MEPRALLTAIPHWCWAATAQPLALWGEHQLKGIHPCPPTGGIDWLGSGLNKAVPPRAEGLGKGRHTGLWKQHTDAGLEGKAPACCTGRLP